MTCRAVKTGGITAIVCTRGRHRRKCRYCGRPAGKLCDWPIGDGKTCDAHLCDRCAVKGGPDVDHCPDHYPAEAA